ncbi:MAG: rhomboid family intramembrane serine protease [Clostridia bacterium]|nr:rhomboid family intramembrane serine protease [Clostridia bacterium]
MKGLSRLELRYGRYAISNLALYIAALNLAVFLLTFLLFGGDSFRTQMTLALIPSEVFKGQVWRLITFILIPDNFSPIWILFTVYLIYMIGTSLERYWGRFKLNIFYLVGILGSIVAAFITGFGMTGMYLNLSLFLAYATLFPEQEFLLFFVLPVKVKYLGILDALYIFYQLFTAIRFGAWPFVGAILVAFLNYILFFGDDFLKWIKLKQQVARNRKRFFDQVRPYDKNRRF